MADGDFERLGDILNSIPEVRCVAKCSVAKCSIVRCSRCQKRLFLEQQKLGQIALQIRMICLDVANGYNQHFVELVRKVRKAFPKHTIMVISLIIPERSERFSREPSIAAAAESTSA